MGAGEAGVLTVEHGVTWPLIGPHAQYSLLIGQVSVCDRYDIAELSLSQLRRCVTLQTGGLSVLVYWATLLLTLATTKVSVEDVYVYTFDG